MANTQALRSLRSFAEFKQVMHKGWCIKTHRYALHGFFNPEVDSMPIQYGLLVPKRLSKRASRRTFIKRRMRVALAEALQAQMLPTQSRNTAYADSESRLPAVNQLVLRLTSSYPKNTFQSAQSERLGKLVNDELLELMQMVHTKTVGA